MFLGKKWIKESFPKKRKERGTMKIQDVLQKCRASQGRIGRGLSLALAAAMVIGSTMTVDAAAIKDVFDAEYYSATYSDLAAAFNTDAKALYNHYVQYGQKEGRIVVPFIDLKKYREAYADLNAAFGDNWDAYLNHYLTYGVYEGRKAFGKSFDARAYADRYADLKAAFGYDVLALYNHYVQYGRNEGRNAMPDVPVSRTSNNGNSNTSSSVAAEEIPATVRTTVTFLDENGQPIPNARVTFTRTGDIGMNNNSGRAASVSDGDVSGNDVSGNDPTPGSVTTEGNTVVVVTDENGQYTVPDLASGVYTVTATADGYMELRMNNYVIGTSGTAQTLPTFEMLSTDGSGTGTVEGYATDATTGAVIAGVTVKIRADWNNSDGDVISSFTTAADGRYSATLPRGYYTVEFAREGYSSVYVNIATSSCFDGRCGGVMSPVMSEVTSNQYRIVLTWGATPSDLDSHLVGPAAEGGYFHVYFANKVYMEGDTVVASLDVDDTSSYGPETVTVVDISPEDDVYYYSVYDYSNGYRSGAAESTYLAGSNANVKVYVGSQLVKEYNVPANAPGTVWQVFKIVNGSIVTINEVNADYSSMGGHYAN